LDSATPKTLREHIQKCVQKLRKSQETIARLQMKQEGTPTSERVPFEVARKHMEDATRRLLEGTGDMNQAEKDYEKWDKAYRMHPQYPQYVQEQEAAAEKWLNDQEVPNRAALRRMRQLIPPDVRSRTKESLVGDGIPPKAASRVLTCHALWLVRTPPSAISSTHAAVLMGQYSHNFLDIVELRAVYMALPAVENLKLDSDGKKKAWVEGFRTKLEEMVKKDGNGAGLRGNKKRHSAWKEVDAQNIGPYDPDAKFVFEEAIKSGAFDATEQPFVETGTANGKNVTSDPPNPPKVERPLSSHSQPLFLKELKMGRK